MYGQKSNLRSKFFINTLCTKTIIQLKDINNFATSLCADISDNSPPPLPLLPHKMYRFKYYVLFYDDDKNLGVWIVWPNIKLIRFYLIIFHRPRLNAVMLKR